MAWFLAVGGKNRKQVFKVGVEIVVVSKVVAFKRMG